MKVRLGIKGKQVLGVTSIVGVVVVGLSLLHVTQLARVSLDESRARADLLAKAIFHRARTAATTGDLVTALRTDPGLRSILESSVFSKNVTFAAIADVQGRAIAHADRSLEGQLLPPAADIDRLLARHPLLQLWEIYRGQGRTFELRQPLLAAEPGTKTEQEFGAIRVGVSTLLIRDDLNAALGPALSIAFAALAVSVLSAMLLAQLLLRPIHVIRSGLTRLGKGEFGVRLDLDQHDEFGELGTFFNAVSAQLSADRTQMAGQVANLESAVEHLQDAVAIVNARGELLFANPAMRAMLPAATPGASFDDLFPADHPVRQLAEQTLMNRQSRGPVSVHWAPSASGEKTEAAERVIMTHAINDPQGELVGVMLIARNAEALNQVQSTMRYSQKLAALGRLSAGVAHEVKNPLNAMMIHLELLKQQFSPVPAAARAGGARAEYARVVAAAKSDRVLSAARTGEPVVAVETKAAPVDAAQALQHVEVIANEIRRLDAVVQGFLKFTRPEDLKLQPVVLTALFDEVIPILRPEAERARVEVVVECNDAPDVNGDPAMLRQAFLNLALNACQAMPNGGTLRMRCHPARDRRVAVEFIDTGVGIKPEHLQRIFDLYFTTKEKGSGIGLSMVYRTVQMHDGEIEVQSTPGVGTTFRVLLPQA